MPFFSIVHVKYTFWWLFEIHNPFRFRTIQFLIFRKSSEIFGNSNKTECFCPKMNISIYCFHDLGTRHSPLPFWNTICQCWCGILCNNYKFWNWWIIQKCLKFIKIVILRNSKHSYKYWKFLFDFAFTQQSLLRSNLKPWYIKQ